MSTDAPPTPSPLKSCPSAKCGGITQTCMTSSNRFICTCVSDVSLHKYDGPVSSCPETTAPVTLTDPPATSSAPSEGGGLSMLHIILIVGGSSIVIIILITVIIVRRKINKKRKRKRQQRQGGNDLGEKLLEGNEESGIDESDCKTFQVERDSENEKPGVIFKEDLTIHGVKKTGPMGRANIATGMQILQVDGTDVFDKADFAQNTHKKAFFYVKVRLPKGKSSARHSSDDLSAQRESPVEKPITEKEKSEEKIIPASDEAALSEFQRKLAAVREDEFGSRNNTQSNPDQILKTSEECLPLEVIVDSVNLNLALLDSQQRSLTAHSSEVLNGLPTPQSPKTIKLSKTIPQMTVLTNDSLFHDQIDILADDKRNRRVSL